MAIAFTYKVCRLKSDGYRKFHIFSKKKKKWKYLLIDFLIFVGGLDLLFEVGLKFPKGI